MLAPLLAAALALPIPNPLGTTLPHYQGAPATPQRYPATIAPQNPFLAPNPSSNIHNDTWMTDAYQRLGPLGRTPRATSGSMPPGVCGSLTFHSRGYLVSVCPTLAAPQARVIDPATLDVLASYELPFAADAPGTPRYQNFAGGGYFFLDRRDRLWSSTKTQHIFVLQVSPDGRSITKVGDYDLTSVLADDERISSALPDFKGRIWFVSKKGGKVGILNPRTRRIRIKRLGEDVQNSFTVDRGAVYVVSSRRMYRFSARRGRPRIDWKVRYRNSGIVKPGQADAGSGTTPTIMRGGYVAITDNADPMNVVVYRKAKRLRGRRRVVCHVPVFGTGAGATENSLITAGRSLFVENNYGYQDPFSTQSGALTEPGFARVDVRRRGCRKVWTNRTERAPSVVPKLSTRTGLIYTYTRDPAPAADQPYFWTAIDARTGKTVWKVYAGSGLGFNNNYAGLALGPDGSAYLGVLGGIVALRDGREVSSRRVRPTRESTSILR
jgi:outer membrane protein assembly factor BamB